MDVIQQAREALAAYWHMPGAHADSLAPALAAVVKAADAGHLIDARRLVALGAQAALEREGPDDDLPWRVWVNGESTPWAPTAADALDAAEREAS